MIKPLIFVSTWKIREGRLEDYKQFAADFLEPKHIEIYGTPSAKLLEADQPLVDAGIPQSVKPLHFTGFTRSTAG